MDVADGYGGSFLPIHITAVDSFRYSVGTLKSERISCIGIEFRPDHYDLP